MDVIVSDKMDQALLRVAEALLRHCEGRLLATADLEDVLTYLKVDLPGEGQGSRGTRDATSSKILHLQQSMGASVGRSRGHTSR